MLCVSLVGVEELEFDSSQMVERVCMFIIVTFDGRVKPVLVSDKVVFELMINFLAVL